MSMRDYNPLQSLSKMAVNYTYNKTDLNGSRSKVYTIHKTSLSSHISCELTVWLYSFYRELLQAYLSVSTLDISGKELSEVKPIKVFDGYEINSMEDALRAVNASFVAGGAVRSMFESGKIDSDIDFFFTTEESFRFMDYILSLKLFEQLNSTLHPSCYFKVLDRREIFDSQDTLMVINYTIRLSDSFYYYTKENIDKNKVYKVQLICRDYANPVERLESFDFTISQFALVPDFPKTLNNDSTPGLDIYFGNYSFMDLQNKKLAINKMTYPVSTLRRLIKFTNRGYYACNGCLTDIFAETIGNGIDIEESRYLYVD